MKLCDQFQKFPSHAAARCFHCDAVLAGPHFRSDYPVGRHMSVCVGGCGMRTWYDLQPEQVVEVSYVKVKLD
jgi:hypothetical protein